MLLESHSSFRFQYRLHDYDNLFKNGCISIAFEWLVKVVGNDVTANSMLRPSVWLVTIEVGWPFMPCRNFVLCLYF